MKETIREQELKERARRGLYSENKFREAEGVRFERKKIKQYRAML